MDSSKSKYSIYGALFSILFSSVLLLGIFLLTSNRRSSVHFTQTDNITVSLSTGKDTFSEPLPEMTEKEISKALEDSENEDLDDLFDSIDSEKIVYSKKTRVQEDSVVNKKFLKKIQTRTKIEHDERHALKRKISKTTELEHGKFKSNESKKNSSGGEKNIYYAKVQTLLYKSWLQPSKNFQQSKVIITINRQGKMRYEIKQVSGNHEFDVALKAHLEYLLDTIFPISPDGVSISFETYFKSKEH